MMESQIQLQTQTQPIDLGFVKVIINSLVLNVIAGPLFHIYGSAKGIILGEADVKVRGTIHIVLTVGALIAGATVPFSGYTEYYHWLNNIVTSIGIFNGWESAAIGYFGS